jgi:hypothetical protein
MGCEGSKIASTVIGGLSLKMRLLMSLIEWS